MAVGNLSRTLFSHRQTDISGQNSCVFICILKDGQFCDVFSVVFARVNQHNGCSFGKSGNTQQGFRIKVVQQTYVINFEIHFEAILL